MYFAPVVAFVHDGYFFMTNTENYAGVYHIKMCFVMVNCFTFLSDRVGFKGFFFTIDSFI